MQFPHSITRYFLALVTALVLTWSGPVWAQSKEMNAAYKQYKELNVQGKYAEAIPFAKRYIELARQEFGEAHHNYALGLNNLAELYRNQGNHAEPEPLYKRALAIYEKALGAEHSLVATSLSNLAGLYKGQGRYAVAEQLFKRARAITEKTLGPQHPSVALPLNNLAELYRNQRRYSEAEPLYKRSLAINEKALGPEHPLVATSLANLAGLYDEQGRYPDALELQRRSTEILRRRFAAQLLQEHLGLIGEQRGAKWIFLAHADLALNPKQVGGRGALTGEAFEVLQLAMTSAAGGAITRMAARFATGSDQVSAMVRRQQDALLQYQSLDQKFIKAVSASPEKRNNEAEKNLREQIASLKIKLSGLDKEIATQFPQYATLMSGKPMTGAEVRKLLGKDEALLTFIRSREGNKTHVFVVRSDSLRAYTVPVSLEDMQDTVAELRAGLIVAEFSKDLIPFDTTWAFKFYEKLFKPAEKMLQGVKHLLVVSNGPLQSLPLGVLVTSKPKKPDNSVDYRDVPWLAKRYAITTLPSVSSLKALRVFAAGAKANKPFIGFGDPVLEGKVIRGEMYSRLPETADELRAMAHFLGADASSIYLGNDATETKVKEINLKSARVIAFSTHGLISGDIKHLAEPALVLTPPDKATEADDGLLTAV